MSNIGEKPAKGFTPRSGFVTAAFAPTCEEADLGNLNVSCAAAFAPLETASAGRVCEWNCVNRAYNLQESSK